MTDLPDAEWDTELFGSLDSGIYGIVDEAYRVRFVGRSQQLHRRVVLLQHAPWTWQDDRWTPVPLVVEPFPEPAPRQIVEQAAMEHYGDENAKASAPRRRLFSRKRRG